MCVSGGGGGGACGCVRVCVRACVRARTVCVDAKFESVLNVISFTVIRAPAWSRPVTSTAVVTDCTRVSTNYTLPLAAESFA